MGKWEKVRLGDVCDVRDGTHDSPKYCEVGYPLITSKNIVNGQLDFKSVNYISKNDFDAINNRSQVDMGDIIMPMIGTIGNPLIVETNKKFAIKNVALIKFSQDKVINAFVYYILNSDMFLKYVKKENRGGTQKFLSLKNIREFIIPLPPLKIQQKIAATLDTAAALLKLRQQQLAELEALIQSVFYQMFGDPVRNEKGWDINLLNDIGVWQSGGTPSRSNANYFIGDINWYTAGELNQLYLSGSSEKISRMAVDESSTKLFKKGSILIGMYDTAAFKMGILTENSASNQACANVLPNETVNNVWLYYNLMNMKQYFLSNRRGIRQKNLNLGMIKNFKIPLPPLSLQTQFAAIVQKIEQQKALVQQSINETQTLFDSLMNQFFK